MKTSVYAFSDYKEFLKHLSSAGTRSWGGVTRLAEAAGCQRSYLSRVLTAELHLTPDHLYGIAESVSLTEDETEYMLTLLHADRAATLNYKKRLQTKAEKMRKTYNDLQNRVHRPAVSLDQKDFLYYSSWMFSALHIIVSIPNLQTTKSIAEHLQISQDTAEATLKQLAAWNLVTQRRGKWSFANSERHIPKDSPLVAFHHQNWRQRAVLDAQNPLTEGLHFSVIQSMSAEALKQVRSKLVSFIEEASRIAGPSESERLVCLNADFFEV
jgi:uncharacterized protein (TIGR02147 family)